MENEKLIPMEQFCIHYNIEISFIQSLSEYGLVNITTSEEIQYLQSDQIKDIEKMIRLHFDLEINLEGIDAIYHLLQRVDNLHNELQSIKNRLHPFEPDHDEIN